MVVTVASATPNTPSGRKNSRKAYESWATGPSPSCPLKCVLMMTLSCTAATPTTAGPINRSTRATPALEKKPAMRGRGRCPCRHNAISCIPAWVTPANSVPADHTNTPACIASPSSHTTPPADSETRLNMAGANAGTTKCRRALSMPIHTAASEVRASKGNITRVKVIASVSLVVSSMPEIRATSGSANRAPTPTSTPVSASMPPNTRSASRAAASSPSCLRVAVNVGTNAEVSAPSASRSRNRFGIRNATKNASATAPAPNRAANTISRASPSSRDPKIAALIRPEAFKSREPDSAIPVDRLRATVCETFDRTVEVSHTSRARGSHARR